jgi:hypothetical protein
MPLRGISLGLTALIAEVHQERLHQVVQTKAENPLMIHNRVGVWKESSAALLIEEIQTRICGDLVKPGSKRGPPLKGLQSFPGAQKRLLYQIFGIVERTEYPVAMNL